ncbi:MAG: complex I NDUFA9 subunit family protein, partial [Vitreoscilla sp.]
LRRTLEDADAAVNLVAILHGSSARFHQVHVQLPELLGREIRRVGGRRLVHVSALGVSESGTSDYLQSKSRGERLVTDEWPDTTVLRPSVIFGAEDRFINTFARLQRLAPFVPLACSEALFQPVWVEDVASAIVECLERSATAGRIYQCAGPAVLTLRELVGRAGRWAGVERPVVPLPLALAQAQAWLMERLPGEPLMSRDNLRSMQTPNVVADGWPSLQDLGIVPRSLEDYLARTVPFSGQSS